MLTKKQLIDALADLKDDDIVVVGLITPPDDEDDGFSETEASAPEDNTDEDGDTGYVECAIDDTEVVSALDDSGAKQLILYANLPNDEEDDTIYIDDDGHYVNADDEYITKEGEPSATPVKADPEDIADEENA